MELNILEDKSIDCFSIIKNMTIADYIGIVNVVYTKRGGLPGQRAPLNTSTAIRIRNRMITDLKQGTILPPVVLGVLIDNDTMLNLKQDTIGCFNNIFDNKIKNGDVTIIDGMQRTTALMESAKDGCINTNTRIRVEFWITHAVNSIIYRMLVLNSGQIPWNVKRQLEVIFSPLIETLQENVRNLWLIKVDENSKRSKAGTYQANQFVELYLNFGTRKENLNIEDALTEEFTKLDLIQVTANKHFTDMFIRLADLFVNLDAAFSKYDGFLEFDTLNNKFKDGEDIFTSHPARVGFFVACSRIIIGIPGVERAYEEQEKIAQEFFENLNRFIEKSNNMSNQELGEFLTLKDIDEVITKKKSGKVGEYERTVFLKAFECLFESNFNVDNMYPCWRAYI